MLLPDRVDDIVGETDSLEVTLAVLDTLAL